MEALNKTYNLLPDNRLRHVSGATGERLPRRAGLQASKAVENLWRKTGKTEVNQFICRALQLISSLWISLVKDFHKLPPRKAGSRD